MRPQCLKKGREGVGYGTSGLFWGVKPTQGRGWELKGDNSQGAVLIFERKHLEGKVDSATVIVIVRNSCADIVPAFSMS